MVGLADLVLVFLNGMNGMQVFGISSIFSQASHIVLEAVEDALGVSLVFGCPNKEV